MLNTLAQIPPGTQAFYDRNLLVRAVPADVHGRFGQIRPISKRQGNQIKFRRYEALTAITTPLTEGVTPSGSQLSVTDITSTLQTFGDFVTITDLVDFTNQDPVLTEAGEVLGEQGGTAVDLVRANTLAAGTNVIFTNGSTRAGLNTTIANDIALRTAIRALHRQNSKFLRNIISATTSVSTTPVRKAYVSIVRADTEAQLESVSGYLPVSEYSSAMRAEEDEVGSFRNIRFFASENAKVFINSGAVAGTMISTGANADVYITLILGANAYGVVPLTGEAMRNIIKPLGSAGAADPLNQRATSGWKAITTTQILNQNFMTRIEHTNLVTLT